MYDLHPIADNWIHWAVINIPSTTLELPEGVSRTSGLPTGSKELINSFGTQGYGGPCPPSGTGAHEYKIILYALNVDSINLNGSINLQQFQAALDGKIIDKLELSGYFGQ